MICSLWFKKRQNSLYHLYFLHLVVVFYLHLHNLTMLGNLLRFEEFIRVNEDTYGGMINPISACRKSVISNSMSDKLMSSLWRCCRNMMPFLVQWDDLIWPHTVDTTVTRPLEGMPFNSFNILKYSNSFYVICCAIRLPTFFPTKNL